MKIEVAMQAWCRVVGIAMLAGSNRPLRFQIPPRLAFSGGSWSSLHQNERFVGNDR
jgi:hypothetical protein